MSSSGRHLIRTRKRGRQTRTGRGALHGPDTHHGNVEVSWGASAQPPPTALSANTQPAPEFNTAGILNGHQQAQGKSARVGPRTQKQRHSPSVTGEARIWNPGPRHQTKNTSQIRQRRATSLVETRHRPGDRGDRASSKRTQRAPEDRIGITTTPLRAEYIARQATSLRK